MTREEAIKLLEHISIAYTPTDAYGDYDDPRPYEEALNMAIEALSASGDIISRADVLNIISEAQDGSGSTYEVLQPIFVKINALPSAEQVTSGYIADDKEVPRGEWLMFDGLYCSNCHYKLQTTGIPTYCPSCGARMENTK